MNFKITFFPVYFILYIVLGAGQELDDNVCYRDVKPKLEKLIDLYKKSPSGSANLTFPNINSLIKEAETIIPSIVNLENAFNQSQSIQSVVRNEINETKNLEDALNLLKQLMKDMEDMNLKNNIHNTAFDTCSEANQLYAKLRKDVTDIKDTGNASRTAMETISKRIEDINSKSEQVKNDLDAINIPELTFEHYVCDSKLQSTIQSIIDSISNIADILRTKFTDVLQEKLQGIQDDVNKTERDIIDINDSMSQEVPKTDITVTNETQPTIVDLTNEIEDLRNKLKNIKLNETGDDLFKPVKEKLNNLRDDYETVLKNIFSKDNMDKVKEELELAEKTLQLKRDREVLKKELADIKKIVKTLRDKGVCSRGKVDVEG